MGLFGEQFQLNERMMPTSILRSSTGMIFYGSSNPTQFGKG